jgi:hypothetical protein
VKFARRAQVPDGTDEVSATIVRKVYEVRRPRPPPSFGAVKRVKLCPPTPGHVSLLPWALASFTPGNIPLARGYTSGYAQGSLYC